MVQYVLVTGAGGFLGSHICRYFGGKGYKIAAVGRFSSSLQTVNSYPNLWKFYGMTLPDIRFINVVKEFQPDLLIHCAGTASVADSVSQPYNDFQRTVEVCAFTLEVIRKEIPQCRFILLSSAAVYGNPEKLPVSETVQCKPVSPYGYHKMICETLAQEYSSLHGVPVSILRIFSAYGEGLRRQVVFDLCRKFTDATGDTIEVLGTGEESRDFIHALDIARAIEYIYKNQADGIFNIASGTQTKIKTLTNLIQNELHSNKNISFRGVGRKGDPLNWEADISRLSKLGYCSQVDFIEGVKSYVEWFKQNN